MNEVRKEWSYSSAGHLGEDFIGGSEEGDRVPLSDLLCVSPFGIRQVIPEERLSGICPLLKIC